MARMRVIKPEFFTDATLAECSTSARLLFVATWCFADDYGGLDRSAKQLKGQAFPHDNLDVEPLLQELLDAGVLAEYQSGGKNYLHIKNFAKHQHIDRPSKRRTPVYADSLRVPRVRSEGSTSPQRALIEGSTRKLDLYREKIRGKRKNLIPHIAEAPEWAEIRAAYPKRAGGQRWPQAFKHACARVKEGSAWGDLLAGVRRYANYVRAVGNEGTQYVQQAATFFGPTARGYAEDWKPPPTKAEALQDRNRDAAREFLALDGGPS